eukprot:CAMPEP_0198337778 /NCGR_PEP_ID=MMETSP1450-20131203/31293_1 /TAXON_ID=753684 ORGANISM="Madagascaria erythrocladiodes, Strain CCMP3234" /NCGR_SAMPLE_ID=MMETSP1450 /ASSEMBLY_ACC=CAM_ASM_001115 /LENGTH=328 /DNA_ID=CAMNT_0044042613 /DNA_START=33 /DNA_END=1016 /DNA_ORIENTATION=-
MASFVPSSVPAVLRPSVPAALSLAPTHPALPRHATTSLNTRYSPLADPACPTAVAFPSAPTPSPTSGPSLLLFRADLRLADHPALTAALEYSSPARLTLVYVFDTRTFGAASDRESYAMALFTLQAVTELRNEIRARGGDLMVRVGRTEQVVADLCTRLRVRRVYASSAGANDTRVDSALRERMETEGVEILSPEDDAISSVRKSQRIPEDAFAYKRDPSRYVEFLTPVDEPERLGALPSHLEAGDMPSMKDLGYTEVNGVPFSVAGGAKEGWAAIRAGSKRHAKCSCSYSLYLVTGCLSKRELYTKVDELPLNAATVRSELLWGEYW